MIGVALDALIGDPRRGHPVAAFGRAAAALEASDYADSRRRGAAHTAACVAVAIAPAALIQRRTRGRPLLRLTATAITAWAVTGARSLRHEAERTYVSLSEDDLPAAREILPSLCGRDPSRLGSKEIARAVIESVAENTSDAVVAPLLWGAVAGLPGLAAYRAINTLDAMIGHRSPRYERFGWAAARLDDAANWIPARITALLTIACAPLTPTPKVTPTPTAASTPSTPTLTPPVTPTPTAAGTPTVPPAPRVTPAPPSPADPSTAIAPPASVPPASFPAAPPTTAAPAPARWMAPSMSVGARNVPPQRDGWRHPCAKLAAAGEVPAREVTAEDASAGDVPAREAAAGDAAAGDTDARDTAAVRDVWRALRGDREYRGPDTEAAREAWRALRRYGGQHPSPNAGRCEAAFAGALGIRLGGTNVYHGITETRPGLGDGRPPDPVDIPRAIRLSRNITLAATAVAALIALSRPQPARGPTT